MVDDTPCADGIQLSSRILSSIIVTVYHQQIQLVGAVPQIIDNQQIFNRIGSCSVDTDHEIINGRQLNKCPAVAGIGDGSCLEASVQRTYFYLEGSVA